MKPVIAIPWMKKKPFHGLVRSKYMQSKYVLSLHRAGARIHWLRLNDLNSTLAESLTCDGLLLPGGPDVSPALYGQEPHPKCGKPNKVRDTIEPVLLREFLKTGKPVFCICRGEQVLNVALGGTLLQDISELQKSEHNDFKGRSGSCHDITITKGSLLHKILQTEKTAVNSIHHQVADAPGDGLVVTARSEEGFAEAVELTNHPFCLGVQWHPEHMTTRSKLQRRLFTAFVAACKEA